MLIADSHRPGNRLAQERTPLDPFHPSPTSDC
jgi:hypothetical protein